tara:strand:- start:3512 stop:4744 length:1233 start_codon:yes stop_codon:yes gene_type:complete
MQNKLILNEGYAKINRLFTSAQGSNIFIKKKKYLDLSFCAGSLLLGHNNKILKKSLKEILNKNISNLAAPNEQANEYSKILNKVFKYSKRFIYCNSGTEAVTKSLRICGALSKKKLIIAVTGSWHGSVDNLLYSTKNDLKPFPLSDGLNIDNYKKIKFIPYNDIKKSEKIIKKFKNSINCIIIEPIQGCLPTKKAKQYLIFLRKITKKYKINLIFDEMITGLRTEGTSLQSYFKIYPDISVFGKCFGGGLPMGIIGISKKIDDQIKRGNKKIFFGGTFSGNSIATYVGMKTTKFILKNKKSIFSKLEKNSDFFQKELNNFFLDKKIKAKVYRFKSMLRIVYSNKDITNRIQRDFLEKKNIKKIEKLRKFLLKRNIYYPTSGVIFFSTATSKNDIIKLIKSFKIGCQKFLR